MRHFCTYFNSGYLDRALVLLESMRRWIPEFTLDVLAFDDGLTDFFASRRWPEVRVVPLAAFEARNPDVAAVKQQRSRAEYFFTCTGAWIHEVFELHPEIDVLTYLDADLCFFSSAEPIYEALGARAILITAHDPLARPDTASLYGRYNVGLLTFRNSAAGRACVRRWRDQCVAWCYDRLEDGKFADQKYLDAWPEVYPGQVAVAPPGINAGPWSLRSGGLGVDAAGCPLVDGRPLVAYHFQGVRLFSSRHYYVGYYFSFNPASVLQTLYEPYVRNLVFGGAACGLRVPGQGRYRAKGWLYRWATGYWVGLPFRSRLVWLLHHYVLRIA